MSGVRPGLARLSINAATGPFSLILSKVQAAIRSEVLGRDGRNGVEGPPDQAELST